MESLLAESHRRAEIRINHALKNSKTPCITRHKARHLFPVLRDMCSVIYRTRLSTSLHIFLLSSSLPAQAGLVERSFLYGIGGAPKCFLYLLKAQAPLNAMKLILGCFFRKPGMSFGVSSFMFVSRLPLRSAHLITSHSAIL